LANRGPSIYITPLAPLANKTHLINDPLYVSQIFTEMGLENSVVRNDKTVSIQIPMSSFNTEVNLDCVTNLIFIKAYLAIKRMEESQKSNLHKFFAALLKPLECGAKKIEVAENIIKKSGSLNGLTKEEQEITAGTSRLNEVMEISNFKKSNG
jgi:hypothetical protein